MARPKKAVVDYFPLVCQFGDSITALENIYGNDGFLVWIKLLQKLGRTEYHIIDIRSPKQWKLFYSIFKLEENLVKEIIEELVDLECLDKDFYEKGFIFSENFIENIADAYKKRNSQVLTKSELWGIFVGENSPKSESCGISGGENPEKNAGNPQTKLKEIKGNEIKEKSLSHNNEEKISNEEREILKNYIKRQPKEIQNIDGYLYTIIENGSFKSILQEEKARIQRQKELEEIKNLNKPDVEDISPPVDLAAIREKALRNYRGYK